MGIYKEILKLKGISFNEPLSRHTTFKIGGKAEVFVTAENISDLKILLKFIKKNNLKFFVIGAGSNLLVSDSGFKGAVISLGKDFKYLNHNGEKIFSGSAVPLARLINYTSNLGLSGLERLAGIPGLIGGSLAMNAGIKNISIGDFLDQVFVSDRNGKILNLFKKDIKFGYRSSSLSKYIILGAWFNLNKKSPSLIKKDMGAVLNFRRVSQDLGQPSAGCIFKNPKDNFAGKLIEACNLKGKNIGDAYISNKHANFIINKGNAKASDVLKLMNLAKFKVKRKFNICLLPEIKIVN